jgi:hypothetical protein
MAEIKFEIKCTKNDLNNAFVIKKSNYISLIPIVADTVKRESVLLSQTPI